LWRVREDVWEKKLKKSYVPKNKWHPGLSILKEGISEYETTVPILHGTSGTKGPIIVSGITSPEESVKYKKKHKCVFGKIVAPAHLEKKIMNKLDKSSNILSPKLGPRWYEEYSVIPNRYKPRLDSKEQEQLEKFLKEKMAEDE
jgi:hypothetical protein